MCYTSGELSWHNVAAHAGEKISCPASDSAGATFTGHETYWSYWWPSPPGSGIRQLSNSQFLQHRKGTPLALRCSLHRPQTRIPSPDQGIALPHITDPEGFTEVLRAVMTRVVVIKMKSSDFAMRELYGPSESPQDYRDSLQMSTPIHGAPLVKVAQHCAPIEGPVLALPSLTLSSIS